MNCEKNLFLQPQKISMAEKKQDETIVDVDKIYTQSEDFFEKNKKSIGIVGGILIAIVGGILAYNNLYMKPRQAEAQELIWKAQYYFEIDSLDKAINGDGVNFGFEYIASEYGDTKSGDLAHYYLGVCYLNQGQYELAIENFKASDLDDEMVGAIAKGGIADALVELGDLNQAISYYEKAVSHSENNFTAPLYLMKKAVVLEELGNFKEALAVYETIKKEYPESAEGQDIEKYIAKASSYVAG